MRALGLVACALISSAASLNFAQAGDTAAAQGAAAREPLPSSLLWPLYLGPKPPEVRAVRHVLVAWKGAPGALATVVRTREEAAARAAELAAVLRAGADFDALSSAESDAHNSRQGGVLGSAGPGMLLPVLDRFLFSAEQGAVSDPIELPIGFAVLQRIEPHAAGAQIFLAGHGDEVRARTEALAARVAAGEDFAAVAKESSEDTPSRERGGLMAIYERGPIDSSIKLEVFRLAIGQVSAPYESAVGWHLLKRLPLEGVDPSLAETTWVRARAILIAHRSTPGSLPAPDRSAGEAKTLVDALAERIKNGEDMAELARQNDDDFGGKLRAGDLGWVHRHAPRKLPALDRLFRAAPGELIGPLPYEGGWVLLRREG